jgi:tetratricopeptide (TPR) repeat protein
VVATVPVTRPIVTAPTTRITPLPKPEPPAPPIIARFPRGPAPVLARGNRAAAETAAAQTTTDRVTALGKAVELDPSWSTGWQQLVRAALEAGRVDIALTAGEAATTLEPRSPAAHQLFAAALARSAYSADAADELEEAVKLGSDTAANRLALAGLYVRELRDPNRARPHYRRVLELDPNHPQAAAIRAWFATNPE